MSTPKNAPEGPGHRPLFSSEESFGKQEAEGSGLCDETAVAAIAGVPVLTAVKDSLQKP
ncbi:DUF2478 domain-containing protein [Noviherbaspirillum sp. ST9]|uniref:DUF2478 domain-containing protein n=1 Tax=Noviherbaspirillum sp. ST9 TaxID=3401606 RepID=UPI003B58A6E1